MTLLSVIAHRLRLVHLSDPLKLFVDKNLSTIQSADSVVVMKEGLVVEQGTYHDLVNMNGLFSSLIANQTTSPLSALSLGMDPSTNSVTYQREETTGVVKRKRLESDISMISDLTVEEGRTPNVVHPTPTRGPSFEFWAPVYLGHVGKQWKWFTGGTLATAVLYETSFSLSRSL